MAVPMGVCMPNHLADKTSPYLRAHADDPVDWYPWGDEAFTRAQELDRPIFLSIGYASCHWCHVMHRESFADSPIAEQLNASFVSIKVDREERPDVDELYMAYVVAANGHGGWPMSVFLTPELVPFFGGTYFPPEPRHGTPGFSHVLGQLQSVFLTRRGEIEKIAEETLSHTAAMFAPAEPVDITRELVDAAADRLVSQADPRHGGFGPAPKFPQAPVTDFLLEHHLATGNAPSLAVVETALEAMVRGGIYDQAGGGIARYAVDAAWVVPHFEKMLYDNALLLSTLACLHRIAPRDEWAHAMRGTIAFLERDLEVDGFFASSLDADTLGKEGATYVWSYEELTGLLDADELALARDQLGVTPDGNFEGANILVRPAGRRRDAERADDVLGKLLSARRLRPQPARDDKIIVSWNALAARGLMRAGDALGDAEFIERGVSLTRMLIDHAVHDDGNVQRLVGDSASSEVRILEDAAGLALAALEAADFADDEALVTSARHAYDVAYDAFCDGEGTWYVAPFDTELPVRPRDRHDNPTPSGAALAALAALRLGAATGETPYRSICEQAVARLAPAAFRSPSGAGAALSAMLELLGAS
jgi:uncharacterized protein YyaL (SSP411 family)